MARGNIAAALEELREERDRINFAIETLEKLDGSGAQEAPASKKRGGGRKAVQSKPAAAAPSKPARGFPRTKVCDDCGTKFSQSGPRSRCPSCNPKTVSPKDLK